MHKKQVKIYWNVGSILYTIICLYILYYFCIQIQVVYIIFMMYIFVDQNVCIQNVQYYTKCFYKKMYPTFRQNFVYILYTIFSCHSFNFAYKIYTKVCRAVDEYIFYTFYIHQLYIDLAQLLYTKCIHNFRVGHPFQKF